MSEHDAVLSLLIDYIRIRKRNSTKELGANHSELWMGAHSCP